MKRSVLQTAPSLPRTLLACTLALALAACSSSVTPSAPSPASAGPTTEDSSLLQGTPTNADITVDSSLNNLALTIAVGNTAISGKNWNTSTNGYGPVEINKSNGENGTNDGRKLTLNGKVYSSGYGVHAYSQMTFAVGGKCRALTADIGVDDEVGSNGSVTFQVFGDGVKLFDSGVMTGTSTTNSIKVDVAGRNNLQLVVTDGGNGNGYDHADWAVPTLTGCEASALPVTSVLPTLPVREGQDFKVDSTVTVRYGAGTSWVTKTTTGTGSCTNAWFGSDPVVGTAKGCEVAPAASAAPAPAPTPAPAPAPTPAPAPAPTPAPAPAPTYSAPLTITRGGTYSGAWESLDPNVPAVKVMTNEPVVLENCLLRGKGHLIQAPWVKANLTVRGCKGVGLNPNDVTRTPGRFLHAEGFSSLLIERNTFEKTAGIYLNVWSGDGTNPTTVTVRQNLARNIEGRFSDGNGGYQTSFYRVQFVQLNNIANLPRAEIAWNRVDETPRESHVEDTINLHATTGTAASPIRIHNNLINGAYHGTPDAGYSGGGIMLGDGGGAYQEAANNVVLETSNYGIAVASGNNLSVKDNLILGTGKLSDGTLLDGDPDAGIYLRDYANDPAHIISSVVASGNTVGWGRPRTWNMNARWDYGIDARGGVGVNNVSVQLANAAVDSGLLTRAIADWSARATAAGLPLGAP